MYICLCKKTSKSGEPILSNFGVVYRDLKDGLGPVGIKFAKESLKTNQYVKKIDESLNFIMCSLKKQHFQAKSIEYGELKT